MRLHPAAAHSHLPSMLPVHTDGFARKACSLKGLTKPFSFYDARAWFTWQFTRRLRRCAVNDKACLRGLGWA